MSPRLLQLASAALPVGGFAYSRGLEAAVERGWVSDAEQADGWIGGLLRESLLGLDAPLLLRLHAAVERGDTSLLQRWTAHAAATRETEELAQESDAMGAALLRWANSMGLAPSAEKAPYLTAFAITGQRLGLGAESTLTAYMWSWLEGMVTAAVKLVPLGQTAGQRILLARGAAFDSYIAVAKTRSDDAIGSFTPGYAIASCHHETLHTRLYRS
ncbi:MAG: urease accessory protein UreF [Sandaracinaceae bacterium]